MKLKLKLKIKFILLRELRDGCLCYITFPSNGQNKKEKEKTMFVFYVDIAFQEGMNCDDVF